MCLKNGFVRYLYILKTVISCNIFMLTSYFLELAIFSYVTSFIAFKFRKVFHIQKSMIKYFIVGFKTLLLFWQNSNPSRFYFGVRNELKVYLDFSEIFNNAFFFGFYVFKSHWDSIAYFMKEQIWEPDCLNPVLVLLCYLLCDPESLNLFVPQICHL